ncbi:MAG: nucleotidyltransferase domain-containing protein [bacterium]
MDKSKIEELRRYFEKRNDVCLAFLFGSQAKSVFCQESDVDLAVYLNDTSMETQIWLDVERIVKKEVDLIILNRAKPIISWEAIRGIPLIIKDDRLYLNFLLEVSWEAQDLIEFNIDAWKMKEEVKACHL